ncbi:EAL domain-containing protein [Pseudomonas tritici]|uniref:EAL domain-containing protein n=1 Tax=Pseudomonas tritici TaxID=2745518 RepID=UPI00387B9BBF
MCPNDSGTAVELIKHAETAMHASKGRGPDEQLISAIIGMGKSLGLTIIAEGVETFEQLNFLQHQLCEEGQGYLFSKAVPSEDFAQLLQKGCVTLMPDQ